MTVSDSEIIHLIADRVDKVGCKKCNAELDVSTFEMFSTIACPSCGTQQTVPGKLGNFLLIEILGMGGMAAVYHAYDQALGRHVAIKVMRRELGSDSKFLENFLREARAAAQLNHLNVVQIYSFGQEKGQPYIVMEMMTGGRLDEMIARGVPLDELQVLDVALDIATGLNAASQAKLIHGDIKPANILFDKKGIAKVVDFGLARFQQRGTSSKVGEIWGTPYYIAPEKINKKIEDERSDIYSLGATLYHALSAKPPFEGDTATDVVLARLKKPPQPLTEIRSDLHPTTIQLITRMLVSDPSLRYPTYSSLISDIREAIEAAKKGPVIPPKPAKERKKPGIPAIVGGILLLGAVGAGLYVWNNRKGDTPPTPPKPGPMTPGTTGTNAPPEIELLAAQPFVGIDDETVIEGINAVMADKPDAALKVWTSLENKFPQDDPGRAWLAVLNGLHPWFKKDKAALEAKLTPLTAKKYAAQPDGSPHPAVMAQAIARFMLGQAFERPAPGSKRDWPAWYDHLVRFFQGIDSLQKNDLEGAHSKLASYLAVPQARGPQWPYALKPVARIWVGKFDAWESQRKQAETLVKQGKPAAAVDALQKFRGSADDRLYPLIDKALAEARQAVARTEAARNAERQRQEAAQRAAQEKARLEEVQLELEKLDALRGDLLAHVAQKTFAQGAGQAGKAAAQFKQKETLQMLGFLEQSYKRMEDGKQFIIQSIGSTPYRRGTSELAGDVVAASDDKLRITLPGGAGNIERLWAQVTARSYVDMLSFYAGSVENDRKKADMALSLALYVYYNGAYGPAARYAENAVQINPALKTTVNQLMPDLLGP